MFFFSFEDFFWDWKRLFNIRYVSKNVLLKIWNNLNTVYL